MQSKLYFSSGVFAVVTIILFFSSMTSVDTGFGSITVANIQGTVFCGACFVCTVTCAVGGMVAGAVEEAIADQSSDYREMINRIGEKRAEKSSETPKANETVRNDAAEEKIDSGNKVRVSENPEWKVDEAGMVCCPGCGTQMSLDYIKARKKCPDCGCIYKQ